MTKWRACVSPVDRALLFGHDGLQVGELEEVVVEVVQMEDARQQEGSGDENPGEQLGHRELLQAQVLQAAQMETFHDNKNRNWALSYSNSAFVGYGGRSDLNVDQMLFFLCHCHRRRIITPSLMCIIVFNNTLLFWLKSIFITRL